MTDATLSMVVPEWSTKASSLLQIWNKPLRDARVLLVILVPTVVVIQTMSAERSAAWLESLATVLSTAVCYQDMRENTDVGSRRTSAPMSAV